MNKPAFIKENIKLAPFTTFKIGGPAEYFAEVSNLEEIREALHFSKKANIPYFILGGGSNVLIPDDGLKGLVIKNNFSEIKKDDSRLIVGSGCFLSKILAFSRLNNLSGLEWCIGIPGTLGGAIVSNAGVKDKSISQIIEKVGFIDNNSPFLEIKYLKNEDCQFGYRKSLFSQKHWIIWQIELKLKEAEKDKILQEIKNYQQKRLNQPKLPSAGCVFKNIKIADLDSRSIEKLKKEFPEVEDLLPSGVIPAGWLIERLDFKGKTIGKAQVSPEHANFIVNLGGATRDNVCVLIAFIKERARTQFGIQLQEEINIF